MKLKGELELTAEKVYDIAESKLYNLNQNKLEDISEKDLEEQCNTVFLLYTARQLTEAILTGDYNLEEINGIKQTVETGNGFIELVQILQESKSKINLANIHEIVAFLKLLRFFEIRSDSNEIK